MIILVYGVKRESILWILNKSMMNSTKTRITSHWIDAGVSIRNKGDT